MRKWWFSIVCWAAALVCVFYSLFWMLLNYHDVFANVAYFAISFCIGILLVFLGFVNRPRKDDGKRN